jgi:hypothetical protein
MQIEIVDFAVASPCDGASTRQTEIEDEAL